MIFPASSTTSPSGWPSTVALMSMRRCLFWRLICDGPTPLTTCANAPNGTLPSVSAAPTFAVVPMGFVPTRIPLPLLAPVDPVTLVVGPFEPPGVRLPEDDEPPPPADGVSSREAIELKERRSMGGACTMIGYCTPLIW